MQRTLLIASYVGFSNKGLFETPILFQIPLVNTYGEFRSDVFISRHWKYPADVKFPFLSVDVAAPAVIPLGGLPVTSLHRVVQPGAGQGGQTAVLPRSVG